MNNLKKILFRAIAYASGVIFGLFLLGAFEYGTHWMIFLGLLEAVVIGVLAEMNYRQVAQCEQEVDVA